MIDLSRRGLLSTSAALSASPALAQPYTPAEARAAPAFCRLRLVGTNAPAGSITVFAHAFRPGDVPRGAGLIARAGNTSLDIQIDILNRHEDRSARLAIIAISCPVIAAGRQLEISLSATSVNVSSIDLIKALDARQAVVRITGRDIWQFNLIEAYKTLSAIPIQSGPLVLQNRVSVQVPQAVTGVSSLRLVADISLRRDGTVWLDVWLRNDVAMRPGGGSAAYGITVSLDGREATNIRLIHQPQYTSWGRQYGSLRGTTAPAPPLVRHDTSYLADAGVVPRYNTSIGVQERLLAGYAATMASPAWNEPLSPRGVAQYMPGTGDRDDIGVATMSQAAWLITGDRRASAYVIGQAEASGAVPWNMWDPAGGEGSGGWLDARRWPRLWTDGRGGRPPGGLQQPVPSDTGWSTDPAHQPDLSLVPLLMTGRRAFLDNLQAQAAWNVLAMWPAPRGNGEGLIVRGNQVRGAAWGLRTLGNASWASPDGDANTPYLREITQRNWRWIRARIPEWTTRQGEAYGWIPGEYGLPGVLPPWQQDYFASVAAIAAQRGDADARAVLEWMSNFIAGRFLAGDRGFNPRDGVAYVIAITPTDAPERPLMTWSAIGTNTRARGLSNLEGWSKSQGNFSQLALDSLTALANTLNNNAARRAHAWLRQANPPFTSHDDYLSNPKLNVSMNNL